MWELHLLEKETYFNDFICQYPVPKAPGCPMQQRGAFSLLMILENLPQMNLYHYLLQWVFLPPLHKLQSQLTLQLQLVEVLHAHFERSQFLINNFESLLVSPVYLSNKFLVLFRIERWWILFIWK